MRAARNASGEFPGYEYLESLDESARAGLDVSIKRLADHGQIFNQEKFKPTGTHKGLFTFKSGRHRLLGFFCGKGVFLITNGYSKKNKRINKKDRQNINRGQTIRRATEDYLEKGIR